MQKKLTVTEWQVLPGNHWCNPKPVCFDSLPQRGWIAKDKFDWGKISEEVSPL